MTRKKERPKDLLDWMGLRSAPDWGAARSIGGLFSMVLAVLFVLALVAAGALLVRTIGGGEGSLGAGALIVAVLSSPFLIWNTIIKQRALEFQKEGHLTDRLAKAVEQLGAEKTVKKSVMGEDGKPVTVETTEPNLEVRMGGLLSLERIAQDSTAYDKGRDHVPVMEIICAYIRNNAPASMAKDFPEGDLEELPKDADQEQLCEHLDKTKRRHASGGSLAVWISTLLPPREDIMLALNILERRSARQRRIESAYGQEGVVEANWVFDEPCPTLPDVHADQRVVDDALRVFRDALGKWKERVRGYSGYRLDLRGCCLQNAMLSGFRLGGVYLSGSRLEGTNLRYARLEGAELMGIRLEFADLRRARLEGAFIGAARLEGVDLIMARMEGVELFEVRLEGAFLAGAWLGGASLDGVRLEGALIVRAHLEETDFTRVRLEGVNFEEVRLEGADLRGLRLNESTKIRGADFRLSALRSLDFSNSAIMQEKIDGSFGDSKVILPDGINRPKHWPEWDLWQQFDDEWHRWRADPANYTPPPPPN